MSLVSRLFAAPKASPEHDFRRAPRRLVLDARPPLSAVIDGRRFPLYDLSELGLSLAVDEIEAPTTGVADLMRGDALLRRVYLFRCWGSAERTGYKFAQGLDIVETAKEQDPAERLRGLKRRVAMLHGYEAVARKREGSDGVAASGRPANATESPRPNALRRRLSLKR